jgi:chromosome segregation ATPase
MQPVSGYSVPVWPPPPLPPINNELSARLEALEAQQGSAQEVAREKKLEQLRAELQNAQDSASECKRLELQLEQCNNEWRYKFDALEGRYKHGEAAGSRRMEEAVREAELKGQEELAVLRLELQAVKDESGRTYHDHQASQDEISRLRHDVQAARDAEQMLKGQIAEQALEILKLRENDEKYREDVSLKTDKLRGLERSNKDLLEELEREKAGARDRSMDADSQRRQLELTLEQIRDQAEELKINLQRVTQQRDRLDSDLQSLKKAAEQRHEECEQLRKTIREQQYGAKSLQLELQSRKAQNSADASKAQLEEDRRVSLGSGGSRTSVLGSLGGRRSVSPRQLLLPPSFPKIDMERQSLTKIDVDLTNMEEDPRGKRHSSGQRVVTEVDIEEFSSDSDR